MTTEAIERPHTLHALARAAEDGVRRERQVQVDNLLTALAWADACSVDPATEPAPPARGGEALVPLGGEGTPEVRELAMVELAVARCEHVLATRSLLADGLDLRHRLPRFWSQVQALACPLWVARRIARMSRALRQEQIGSIDAVVAKNAHQPPGKLLPIAEKAVLEADTRTARERLEANRRKQMVSISSPRPGDALDENEAGLRSVYARVDATDAVWLDATIERLADALAARPEHADTARESLRAEAFGMLGRPDRVHELLNPVDAASPRTPTRRAIVYVHLHQAAARGPVPLSPVGEVEGLGPMLLDQLTRLLTGAQVTLTPVIDLHQTGAVDGYAHPEKMRERIILRTRGEVFPHSPSRTRRIDLDHAVPYRPGGPPGQTGDHNTAPLTRRHHRAKTHLGYTVQQTGIASWVWRTPHGLVRRVDPTGTHVLPPDDPSP